MITMMKSGADRSPRRYRIPPSGRMVSMVAGTIERAAAKYQSVLFIQSI